MCTCQGCRCKYGVDFVVPDEVWEIIKPKGKGKGEGLLCGSCIAKKIDAMSDNDSGGYVYMTAIALGRMNWRFIPQNPYR